MTPVAYLRKRGFTLMETVLVIAVGIGLLVGGIVFFQQAESARVVSDKTKAFNAISSEIRSQYDKKVNYTGLSKASLEATSMLPAWMLRNMMITPLTGTWPRFTILASHLDQKQCQKILANQSALGTNIRQVLCFNAGSTGYSIQVQYGR